MSLAFPTVSEGAQDGGICLEPAAQMTFLRKEASSIGLTQHSWVGPSQTLMGILWHVDGLSMLCVQGQISHGETV